MAFDEDEWVGRFVAKGGDPDDGRKIARRMREAQSAVADSVAVAAACPEAPMAAPAPARKARDVLAAERVSALGSPPAQAAVADLFGFDPGSAQEATPKAAPSAKARPPRRGRKPTELHANPPSQRERDLFELSLEVEKRNAKESGDHGFLATAMIYASLPHSSIDGGIFKRRNNDTTLTIMNDPDIGLPYGKLPRLITAFLCTEAKRREKTHGPMIDLGRSQAEFMRRLGLQSSGGKRGDIGRVRDQARRLFTSTITLIGEPGSQFHWKKVNISDAGMLLWDPHDPSQESPWQSTLTLSQPFFEECVHHSVPINLAVLHQLRSPLAIDIYVWLTYRFNSIVEPTPITWRQLQWQFGANYGASSTGTLTVPANGRSGQSTSQGERDFKANFRRALRQVLIFYRDAKIDVQQDFVKLYPSKTHVPPLDHQG